MRTTQTHRIPSRRRVANLALVALSVLAVGAPVAAREVRGPQLAFEDTTTPDSIRLPVDKRGNWMREYVQLRVAQQLSLIHI